MSKADITLIPDLGDHVILNISNIDKDDSNSNSSSSKETDYTIDPLLNKIFRNYDPNNS